MDAEYGFIRSSMMTPRKGKAMNASIHKATAMKKHLSNNVHQIENMDINEVLADWVDAFPKVTKFVKKNWRPIAISTAAASLGIGVYYAFFHDRSKS